RHTRFSRDWSSDVCSSDLKREIMVRAHELAKAMKGDYSARMSAGLKRAWLEARLIAMGGKVWEKGGHRRIYINNLVELYGLELRSEERRVGKECKARRLRH